LTNVVVSDIIDIQALIEISENWYYDLTRVGSNPIHENEIKTWYGFGR